MTRKSRGGPSSKAGRKRRQLRPSSPPAAGAGAPSAPPAAAAAKEFPPKAASSLAREAKATSPSFPAGDQRYLMSELRLIGILSGSFIVLLLALAFFLR
ncbi:MAG: hypothetical protein HY687_00805 [Chloroflexi bacterium]|nr:hypothetical protein [Chloroflexota bacterium]